jgi:iron complex outermembrane receptor protein
MWSASHHALVVLALFQGEPTQQSTTPGARDGGQETLVTARKVPEPLAELPGSATVVDGRALDQERLETLRDAASRVPNLYFSEFSARRLSFPFVRGIGSGLNDPAVITYVDDVPQFGFGGTNPPLFEVEQVEFLRGPQGTLFGRNALGGLMQVRSRAPTVEQEAHLGAGFGSYDLAEYEGAWSGPIVGPEVLGGLGFLASERDGFTKNDSSGNRVDDRDGLYGRGQLLFRPGEGSELALSLSGEHARDGGFGLNFLQDVPAFGITGLRSRPHRINQDFEGETERDAYTPSAVWRVLGEELDVTSISAFQSWDVLETSDFDFTPVDGVRRRAEEGQQYFYQELRLGTPAEAPRGELRWLLGASGFLSDSDRKAANEFRPGGAGIFFPPGSEGTDTVQGDFDDYGLALFGQATLPVSARLDLTAGLRLDHEDKEVERLRTFDPGGGPFVTDQGDDQESFDELVPLVALTLHLERDTLAYVSAARGFKAGGFNLAAPTAGQIAFDPETNWTYELGARRSFDQGRFHLGGALFYVDWEDQQLALFDPAVGGYVDNAGESESMGVELEGQAELFPGLDGFASLGLLETEIEEFVDPYGTDTSGNELPFAPETSWSLGLSYGRELSGATSRDAGRPGRWYVSGEYLDVGDFFYDAGNRDGDDYGLANLSAGIEARRVGLSVWLRNAFDEEYVPVAFQPSPVDPTVFVGESGAPRVVGFTLSVHL